MIPFLCDLFATWITKNLTMLGLSKILVIKQHSTRCDTLTPEDKSFWSQYKEVAHGREIQIQ
jgi:hypothetical protein